MDSSAGDPSLHARDAYAVHAYQTPGRSWATENALVERVDAGIVSAMMRVGIMPMTESGGEVRQRAWDAILNRLDEYQPSLGALTTWAYIQTQAVTKAWFAEIHRAPAGLGGFDRVHPRANNGVFEVEMRDLLKILPESDQELVQKVVLEDVSVRTVAEMIGVSHTSVYLRRRRALTILRFQMVG